MTVKVLVDSKPSWLKIWKKSQGIYIFFKNINPIKNVFQ